MSKKYSVRINDSTDITVGHFAMQGMRPTMEDSFTV